MSQYHLQNKKKFFGFVICILLIMSLSVLGLFFLINYLNQDIKIENKNMENFKKATTKNTIRESAVAGQFYPADKNELESAIDNYLAEAEIAEEKGKFLPILIVPHAGYEFSGAVAAASFKQVQEKDFDRIVILGRSHQNFFPEVLADANAKWQTPLGEIAVDREWIEKMREKYEFFDTDNFSHKFEHSLEVQVPFIQRIFSNEKKIVPLLAGDDDIEIEKISQAIFENIDNRTLVIVSTDLSHYPEYQNAKDTDRQTIEAILSGNLKSFQQKIKELKLFKVGKDNLDTLICAEPAVAIAESLAEKMEAEPVLFESANSGDVYPEIQDRVVGYAAIGFYSNKILEASEIEASIEASTYDTELNREEQKKALEIARNSIEAKLDGEDYNPEINEGIFGEQRGAFITLKKNGQLRGCIGNFEPDKNLAENIKEMALSAAFNDPRFSPVQNYEWEDIKIEISVLSPMRKIDDPDSVEVGKHGVYVRQGVNSGVFLPQVATEAGWSREEFLDNLCESKAGIGRGAWRDGSAELYVFTAQVFEE